MGTSEPWFARRHTDGPAPAVDLFAQPLPLPGRTRYDALGLGPDATPEEVRWASGAAADRLQLEETRLAYDRAHPPLALLKLEDCADPMFVDERTHLFLLRLAISAFLEARGEPVFHPSDLTRRDFSDDFRFNPVLDLDQEP
jgi:hypothetical protein